MKINGRKNCVFSGILILTVLFFLITGCAKKEKNTSQITLRLAFYGDTRNKPFGETLIAAFQKTHPDIKIEPVFIVGDYPQKLLTMIAGGTAPDLMVIETSAMVDFVHREILLNLQPYQDKDKEFQSFKSDIHSGSLEGSKYKGVSYAVPFWTNSLVLFYNEDLFDKEGLKYPDETWDWNKLLSAGKKLTKDTNNDGKIDQYGFFSSFAFSDTFGGLYQYIKKNNGQLFSKDMSKCLIESPESMGAIRWCFDLINKYKITPSPFAGDERLRDYEQAFLSGKVAMTISGRWSIPLFVKAKLRWSCAPQPKGRVDFKPSGVTLLGAYAKTKHPDQCWEFLKFMMGKEAQGIVCTLKADMPIRMSVANSPVFLNWNARPGENKVCLEELKGAEEFPHFPREKEWLDSGNRKLQLVLLGKKDLKIACQEITNDYFRLREKGEK